MLRRYGREIRFTPQTVRINARQIDNWKEALDAALNEIERAAALVPLLDSAG